MIPAILSFSQEDDRRFVLGIYDEYKLLIYKVCRSFFKIDTAEVEEAFSAALERTCKNYFRIRDLECNKRASYIVILTENACRNVMRERARSIGTPVDYADNVEFSELPDDFDVHTEVFGRTDAVDILSAFPSLSQRDKELICMRHIDMMSYSEMAEELSMSVGAVRTALSRAKAKLASIGRRTEGGKSNEQQK
ncbi:MAG: sigma-70 family RNA polymerase sigma factor [Eubacteriales bacterium]|nr:sigma-70 family RNA polymerase sigma factor [Eubacteriales bacterium]